MERLTLSTRSRNELIEITNTIKSLVSKNKYKDGFCVIFCPHTTAAITINEAYDSDVQKDISFALSRISPDLKEFKHLEGNSDAHVKTSLVGPSQYIIISNGQVMLGQWQGIYFCEFDGPRTREIWIQFVGTTNND